MVDCSLSGFVNPFKAMLFCWFEARESGFMKLKNFDSLRRRERGKEIQGIQLGDPPIHDGRLLGLFLPEGSKSHFLAHRGVVYILNEARH